ncbi:MAG: TonB-dependent receptor [Prolixibacteraceae bacterium]|nr:TonB-dependent receptor [Prolixibacteraceae bacterium]
MKLTLILSLLLFSQAFALRSYSQRTLINLKMENVTIKEVLREIEDKSEFYFLYNNDLIDVNRMVSIDVKNEKVQDVLSQLFADKSINFLVKDRQIVLSPLQNDTGNNFATDQNIKSVSGKVTDSSGGPLPGVSVVVKGTTTGVITDMDGKYILSKVPENATLQFSFVGMKTQEIAVESKTTINVTLVEVAIGIDEVVAIGYGTQQKRSTSTAISSIASSQMENQIGANISQKMTAMVPGVVVQQTGGVPGQSMKIRVRGTGSINSSNAPLYVVDGYPLSDGGTINSINPSDIESIDILKDAAAAAIYGSRGGNGVVLVTTKKGKAGKTRFDFNFYKGVDQVSKKVDVLNSEEFADYCKDAFTAANKPLPPILSQPEKWAHTDWQDAIFRKANISNYQLTVSGGTEKIRFLLSNGYLQQEGIVKGTSYQRITSRLNVDADVNKHIKVGVNFNPTFSSNQDQPISGHYNTNSNYPLSSTVTSALFMPPIVPVRFDNGDYGQLSNKTIGQHPEYSGLLFNLYSPVAVLDNFNAKTRIFGLLTNLFLEAQIFKGLNFRSNIGTELTNRQQNTYRPATITSSAFPDVTLSEPNLASISAGQTYGINYNWLWENTLNYKLDFLKDHSVNVVVGYTAQKNFAEGNNIASYVDKGVSPFSNDLVPYISNASDIRGTAYRGEWALTSAIARLNYSYKDKYILLGSIRNDASSKFAPGIRSHTFPAASLAWRISEEPFMQKISKTLNEFKLRASYGESGNFNTPGGDYPWAGSLGRADYDFGLGTGVRQVAFALDGFANPTLTWEVNKQSDIGLEAGLFSNRIYLTADAYVRKTTDLILTRQLPGVVGFATSINTNIGSIENKGLEFGLTSNNLNGRFSWKTNFNISFNRNQVLSLGGPKFIAGPDVVIFWASSSRITVGRPLGDYYGFIADGVYMNQADVDANPKYITGSKPGDTKYRDVNKDGTISTADITLIGNSQPDFNYGLTNSFKYDRFELNIVTQGVSGGSIVNGTRRFLDQGYGWANASGEVRNRWRSESNPGNGKIPRVGYGLSQNSAFSSRFLYSASYFAIRNVTLSYTLPSTVTKDYKVENLKMYLSVQNLVTFSKYTGYNPEVTIYGEDVSRGSVDQGGYPLPRSISIGLNIGF